MASRVNTLAGEEIALPYHGSLSRERRFTARGAAQGWRAARARHAPARSSWGSTSARSTSCIQLQSPKRVAAALQRVGRAGHTLDAVSRGVFVPTFRDDALEQLAHRRRDARGRRRADARRAERARRTRAADRRDGRRRTTPEWTAAELFDFVRRAYPYHALTRVGVRRRRWRCSPGSIRADVAAELDARISWDRVDGHAHADARRAHGRHDLRRHDPRPRALHGQPARQDAAR